MKLKPPSKQGQNFRLIYLLLVCLPLATIAGLYENDPILELGPKNFDSVILNSPSCWLVQFYGNANNRINWITTHHDSKLVRPLPKLCTHMAGRCRRA